MKQPKAPIHLIGKPVELDGRKGTIRRWAAQPGGLHVEIQWTEDGTRSWVAYHAVHG